MLTDTIKLHSMTRRNKQPEAFERYDLALAPVVEEDGSWLVALRNTVTTYIRSESESDILNTYWFAR
ncbi:MAG: hypothetical protein IPP36_08655 [Nitrosomonadales bacterium]|nr:hypothetical protein [Nitrosomonadales bacterium]